MSRLRRLDGHSYTGFADYFLTICTFDRQRIFIEAAVVERTLMHFRQAASRDRFELLAYCLMPDHAHFLVRGVSDASDLRRFVSSAKQHSAFAHARDAGQRLWQDGYYDRVLRPTEDPKWVARYIIANPVRAKLAESPREYAFLGSDVWELGDLLLSRW